MKMKRRLPATIYIVIIFAVITEISTNIQGKENPKRRSKEEISGFNKNICDISDRKSYIHCFCQNSRELNMVTKADCWVLKDGILPDDVIWQSFSSQPNLINLSFTVRNDAALKNIPTEALHYLKNLTLFSIKYGNIVNITSFAIANVTNLRTINLTQNQIRNLHKYAFAHLPNLTEINLEQNSILEIGIDVFFDVPELKKLVLAKNNISSISNGAFLHMYNLMELNLNKNNITHLTRHTFDGLANVKKLDLRRNRIHNLTEYTFAELWNLEELLLSKNHLKYVSERAFDGLSLLKNLSLDNNKLSELPAHLFDGIRGLSSLDIRSNELHQFTFDNINPIMDNLKAHNSNLLLGDNNFTCECGLKWMYLLRTETKSQNTIRSLESVTCNMDLPVVTSAHDHISEIFESKTDFNQEILHAGITIVSLNDKSNEEQKNIPQELNKGKNKVQAVVKKATKKVVLNIPPEDLPCPRDAMTTTVASLRRGSVKLGQHEMKIDRFQGANVAFRLSYKATVVLWIILEVLFI